MFNPTIICLFYKHIFHTRKISNCEIGEEMVVINMEYLRVLFSRGYTRIVE